MISDQRWRHEPSQLRPGQDNRCTPKVDRSTQPKTHLPKLRQKKREKDKEEIQTLIFSFCYEEGEGWMIYQKNNGGTGFIVGVFGIKKGEA